MGLFFQIILKIGPGSRRIEFSSPERREVQYIMKYLLDLSSEVDVFASPVNPSTEEHLR